MRRKLRKLFLMRYLRMALENLRMRQYLMQVNEILRVNWIEVKGGRYAEALVAMTNDIHKQAVDPTISPEAARLYDLIDQWRNRAHMAEREARKLREACTQLQPAIELAGGSNLKFELASEPELEMLRRMT